jgi:selenocysteine lyase/cysteine desulfurase
VGGTGSASESIAPPDFLPDALEPGTPNTHGLAGLAAGVGVVLREGTAKIHSHETDLTRRFLNGLGQIKGLTVWGPEAAEQRVAVVAVTLAGWSSSDLSAALEREAGILTRSGLQCSPLAHQALGSFQNGGLTRFSFGYYNTHAEIDIALAALDRLAACRP